MSPASHPVTPVTVTGGAGDSGSGRVGNATDSDANLMIIVMMA
jgi:hypothetical protein